MDITKYYEIRAKVNSYNATLVAVSKTKPIEDIQSLCEAGQTVFGENKVQEMCAKHEQLDQKLHWHMIGHLQRNKVKYMASFVELIHGVDSLKLLKEINKQAEKNQRLQDCLLQIFIADEETKFGLAPNELDTLIENLRTEPLHHVRIRGFMGMATNTDDQTQVRNEFKGLRQLFENCQSANVFGENDFDTLSMGMSGDFEMALDEGSTMVRVGSLIFGSRNYDK